MATREARSPFDRLRKHYEDTTLRCPKCGYVDDDGEFERAARAYDQARTIGLPWRMLWYQFGPFEAYYHAGRYEELISLARATLDVTEHIEEVHYWLGMGLLETGDVAGARRAFRRALKQRPDYAKAAEALARAKE